MQKEKQDSDKLIYTNCWSRLSEYAVKGDTNVIVNEILSTHITNQGASLLFSIF